MDLTLHSALPHFTQWSTLMAKKWPKKKAFHIRTRRTIPTALVLGQRCTVPMQCPWFLSGLPLADYLLCRMQYLSVLKRMTIITLRWTKQVQPLPLSGGKCREMKDQQGQDFLGPQPALAHCFLTNVASFLFLVLSYTWMLTWMDMGQCLPLNMG